LSRIFETNLVQNHTQLMTSIGQIENPLNLKRNEKEKGDSTFLQNMKRGIRFE